MSSADLGVLTYDRRCRQQQRAVCQRCLQAAPSALMLHMHCNCDAKSLLALAVDPLVCAHHVGVGNAVDGHTLCQPARQVRSCPQVLVPAAQHGLHW